MKFELAKSTGFTIVPQPQDTYSEVLHKVLPNPTEDVSFGRSSFSTTSRKDRRIRDLVKKAAVAYTVDAMVRQAVDKYAETFKNFSFEGGERQINYLQERLIKMTLQTGEHWETLLTRIVHEYFKTGNAFIIKRRGGNAIAGRKPLYLNKPYSISGLSLVSADRLAVYTNKSGEFVGWEISGTRDDRQLKLVATSAIKLPTTDALIQITNKVEEKDKNNVLLPGLDVVQVAYKKAADSNWGFGITLAALEDVSMTRTLEQIVAIMMKKFSNPVFHHKILRPSSPLAGIQQEINSAYDLWRRMSPDGVLITGGNSEIKAIGSESQALRVEGYIKYFLYRALAGLGASPYILGLEGGGQGTVEAAVELMMMRVRFCQQEIARELEMFVFNELLWEGGFDPYHNDADRVKLIFEDIDHDKTVKIQTHAADMFTKNLWGHEEARKFAGTKGPAPKDLYLHQVDIPKVKAEAEAKGQATKAAGVAIAKAKPRPVAKKAKKAKEVCEDICNIIPENKEQLQMFFNIMERKYGYDPNTLTSLSSAISSLFGDEEAIKTLLVERLSSE